MDAIEILTATLVVVTAFYAWLTHRIARSNERSTEIMSRQTELLTRPYVEVSVFVPPKIQVLYLRIANTGKTAARNLRLNMDRPFYQYGEVNRNNIAELSAFNQPVGSFPPGAELIFALAQGFVIFGEKADPNITPSEFNVTASYEFENRAVTETTHVELRPYLGSTMEPSPLIEELERIRKAIESKPA